MNNDLIIPLGIQEAIAKDKLVLFIGSGMSQKLGFPSWRKLTVAILNQLSHEDPKYRILKESLEAGFMTDIEALDKVYGFRLRVLELLDKTFSVNYEDLDLLLHTKLGQISSKIITTNYDKALEYANPSLKKIEHIDEYRLSKLPDTKGFIFKLHGCIDSPERCILFKQDYIDLYDNPSIALEELKRFISDHTIIFLGFSLDDDYVLRQFNYISNLYKGLKGNHYLVTTHERSVSNTSIKEIIIRNWSELPSFIEKILAYKNSCSITDKIQHIEINKKQNEYKPKLAILMFNSLDIPTEYSFEKLVKPLNKLNLDIHLYYLSDRALNQLEDFDYIFVFTKSYSERIYIEDRYLKSKAILLKEFEAELLQTKVKGVVIFTDNIELYSEGINLPIILNEYSKESYDSFIFKVFRKGSLQIKDFISVNPDKIYIEPFSSGTPTVISCISKISKGIDPMNFMDFIGRRSDLESIVRKVIEVHSKAIIVKGSGGIGKTTTVKKVAFELAKRSYFTEGISFVNCESIDDYSTFEHKISECFDLDLSINFKEHIQQENLKKDLLIILDNFETLIYLNEISKIIDLISFICGFCTVIITSRELLNVGFEESYPFRQLMTDEAIELFGKYYDISNLSKEEYRILRFDIIEDMLGNNPLAIKIITNNLHKNKSMKILKQELEIDFFDTTITDLNKLFYRDSDINIEKLKSLYNSINYSYIKLNEREKIAYDSLSLFPDGIDLQNFKIYLNQNKKTIHKINDKDLKSLDNKSLIELNNGLINLQSIMFRFATFQFEHRPKILQDTLLKNAYYYMNFILLGSNSSSYKVLDLNKNNFFKIIDNIERIKVPKQDLCLFVASFSITFSNYDNKYSLIIERLEKIKPHFKELEYGELVFDLIIQHIKYYNGHFEEAFQAIKDLVPLEIINYLDVKNIIPKIILDIALSIYSLEGYDYEILSLLMKKQYTSYNNNLEMCLFHLGLYKKMKSIKNYNDDRNDFFVLESRLNENTLTSDELDENIKNTFEKQHLKIFNYYYLKAKLGQINKRQINKLVITNPYALGLKYLILAFAEKDNSKASELYINAIENLKHIKYYHVEAIYFFTKHLKSINSDNYTNWLSYGRKLAQQYKYSFYNHRFRCLEYGIIDNFNDLGSTELSNSELDNYIGLVNKYLSERSESTKKIEVVKNY